MNWSNDGAKPIRIAADLRAVQLSKAAVLGLKFGDAKNAAPFPSMIVIFQGNANRTESSI